MKEHNLSRRTAIKKMTGAAAIISTTGFSSEREQLEALRLKGNINHSVCKWCFSDFTVEELAVHAVRMGIKSIEIVGPEAYPTLKEFGLDCGMSNGPGSISKNVNHVENHAELIPAYIERIGVVGDAGFKNLIIFSGNRDGMDDEEGLENCAVALEKIMGEAEKRGVVICMELLNSKVNHADYMCDHVDWGVKLVDRVGSDNFKLLYDIYHMQIMDGDVIRTIQDYKDYFGHYHTAGNPGRNEIDETQELNYPAIMNAIVETGYTGFVAQEFVPVRDPMTSLRQAIAICDV